MAGLRMMADAEGRDVGSAHVPQMRELEHLRVSCRRLEHAAHTNEPIGTSHSRRVVSIVGDVCSAIAETAEPYDVIIAGGLFDYLSDRFIVRTLREAWFELLAPGGLILFTNIGRGNPFRAWLEHLTEWRLIERSETDITNLCQEAEIPVEPSLTRDATGLTVIVTLCKGGLS